MTERSFPAADVPVDATRYVVRKGDSLYAIAWRFELDYRDLALANGISAPFTIYPGDVLDLRGAEGAWRTRLTPPAPAARPAVAPKQAASPAVPPQRAAPEVVAKEPPARSATRAETARTAPARPKPAPRARPVAERSTPPQASGDGWRRPVAAAPTRRFSKDNRGHDYLLSAGTKVRSASGGVVMYAGPGLGGFRHLVIVKASNRYLAAYGLNVPPAVDEGDAVQAGQVLADIRQGGNVERRFHFEVRQDGKPVDPRPLIGS